jgi:hypothetical protein
MTTITSDIHSFVKKLKAVGFTEEQAKVFASEQARRIEDKSATKNAWTDSNATYAGLYANWNTGSSSK